MAEASPRTQIKVGKCSIVLAIFMWVMAAFLLSQIQTIYIIFIAGVSAIAGFALLWDGVDRLVKYRKKLGEVSTHA